MTVCPACRGWGELASHPIGSPEVMLLEWRPTQQDSPLGINGDQQKGCREEHLYVDSCY
jgi:hypothetical protein